MSDVPRPQETAGPQGEGATAAGPGVAGGGPDSTASAGARLKALRTGPAGAVPGAVPGAVWEDATAQLAGMMQALAILQREVPVLESPPDRLNPPAAGADPATGAGGAGR
jgi:hypothetical protein